MEPARSGLMSMGEAFDEKFFNSEVKEISVSSAERTVFPYKAQSLVIQGGMANLQMMPGRPIDLNKNEKVCITFVKQNNIYRFMALVQTYGVRGPLKLVAQPVSEIQQTLKRDYDRVDCQLPCFLAERVEIRGRWGNKVEESAMIENLSACGLLVRTRYETRLGSTFKVRFFLPNSTFTISAYTDVVRLEPSFVEGVEGEKLIAMKFLTLAEPMQVAIEQFVQDILNTQPA